MIVAMSSGLWSMRVVGRYLRPDGTPQRGYLLLSPPAVSVTATRQGSPFTLTVQAARLDIDHNGYVAVDVLNPNDPGITPGPATGNPWPYLVREVFTPGPEISWWLHVPEDIRDGDTVDLATVPRVGECVTRPEDWFPHHLMATPAQAGRISPRTGPWTPGT